MLLLLAVLASCTCLVLVVFLYMVMLYIVKWPCFDGYDVLFSCLREPILFVHYFVHVYIFDLLVFSFVTFDL
jgi:hypothetical protein